MPEQIYTVNYSTYSINTHDLVNETESRYNVVSQKDGKATWFYKNASYRTFQDAAKELTEWHNQKVSDLQSEINKANRKLEQFKQKYNL